MRIKEFMNLSKEQEAVLDLDSGIFVEAAAGSGKTRALVARYLRILEQGKTDADGIVAITFTENGAAEMRERIRKEVKRYINEYGETNFLSKETVRKISNAPIGTIHGFSARILGENPLEGMLTPGFSVVEGVEKRLFIEKCINEFVLKLWESEGRPEREILERVLAEEGFNLHKLKENVSRIISLAGTLHLEPPWRVFSNGKTYKNGEDAINHFLQSMQSDLKDSPNKYVQSRIQNIRETASKISLIQKCSVRAMFFSEIKRCLREIIELKSAKDEDKETAARLIAGAEEILDIYDTKLTADYLTLAEMAYKFLEMKKRENGFLDYEDLLKGARNLLRDNRHLLEHYRGKFKFIMVDEFQDTDEFQFQIINLLCKAGGANLFVVGDPKQSIFRFRGADLKVFLDLRGRAKNLNKLSMNYRSAEPLIKFFNGFFARVLGGLYEKMNHCPENVFDGRCAELIITPGDTASEWRKMESERIGERVLEMVAGGYQFGDIAILLRSRKYAQLYESALRELGIPCYCGSAAGFFRQREVRDIIVFLRYLIHPKDRIAEASALRSLFLGASDDELLAHYSGKEKVERISSFLNFISGLRGETLCLPPASALERIIEKTGYGAAALALPQGRARHANLNKLIAVAGRLERSGLGIAEVLSYLEAGSAEDSEAPAQFEIEGEDSVKILTVHKAKGLEFPVVFLADLNHSPGGGGEKVLAERNGGFLVRYDGSKSGLWDAMSRIEDAECIEEEKRIFYVANTRAKKVLALCIGGRKKKDGTIFSQTGTFADFLNSAPGLPPDCENEKTINFFGIEIPVWKNAGNGRSLITTDIQKPPESFDIDEVEKRFAPIPVCIVKEKEKRIFPVFDGGVSDLQMGKLMHRFLEVWDFRKESVESTAKFVISEALFSESNLENLLRTLAKNFLRSELMRKINLSKRVYREVPFFIEIDGRHERGKIDLVLEYDGKFSLFDYKLMSEEKETTDFGEQMERYGKAIEKKFGVAPDEKFLIRLPEVELIEI